VRSGIRFGAAFFAAALVILTAVTVVDAVRNDRTDQLQSWLVATMWISLVVGAVGFGVGWAVECGQREDRSHTDSSSTAAYMPWAAVLRAGAIAFVIVEGTFILLQLVSWPPESGSMTVGDWLLAAAWLSGYVAVPAGIIAAVVSGVRAR